MIQNTCDTSTHSTSQNYISDIYNIDVEMKLDEIVTLLTLRRRGGGAGGGVTGGCAVCTLCAPSAFPEEW